MNPIAPELHSSGNTRGDALRPDSGRTFAELYEAYFDFVFRTARRLGVREANVDDVVQEVFIVVHRRLDDYDGRASMKSWIYGILSRVVREYWRSHRRKESRLRSFDSPAESTRSLPATDPEPLELVERRRAGERLLEILNSLDEDKREVLVLAELEQMSIPEISEMLGVNTNTLYSRLKAAKKAVEKAYGEPPSSTRSR